MQTSEIVAEARKLDPAQRLEVVESILQTLDPRDEEIDRVWQEEALRRLAAYRAGLTVGIPAEDVLGPL